MRESHLSDAQLLGELDGELSARDTRHLRLHLAECWKCRTRREELEQTIGDFSRMQRETAQEVPSAAGPRALLAARMAELVTEQPGPAALVKEHVWAIGFAAMFAIAIGIAIANRPAPPRRVAMVAVPDSRLTPGATLLETRESVCAQPNTKNRAVPVALRRKVFEAYGLIDTGLSNAGDYEVDYLITPALGGADDIHNLWPQPYSGTVWNAEVKDALEDRLREMVCDGSLDLNQAQREIAVNWIAAYKKYFHTDRPLRGPYK